MDDITKLRVTPQSIVEMMFDSIEAETNEEEIRISKILNKVTANDPELREFYINLLARVDRLYDLGIIAERKPFLAV